MSHLSHIRSYAAAGVLAATLLTSGSAGAQAPFPFFLLQPQTQAAPQSIEPVAPQAIEPEQAAPSDEAAELAPRLKRQIVNYATHEPPGTVIVDTPNTFLYFVLGNGRAIRYGIGVGREGFTWSGVKAVTRKAEWPDWYPPAEMIQRQPYLPRVMAGGPGNPLGARAMYLGGTVYRIHGTNDPTTIGKHVSSGCIRLTNENAIDLYNRVTMGAKVVVLPQNGATTHQAKAPAQNWQARAQAAIEASRAQHIEQIPARPARTSWNVSRPAGLY